MSLAFIRSDIFLPMDMTLSINPPILSSLLEHRRLCSSTSEYPVDMMNEKILEVEQKWFERGVEGGNPHMDCRIHQAVYHVTDIYFILTQSNKWNYSNLLLSNNNITFTNISGYQHITCLH